MARIKKPEPTEDTGTDLPHSDDIRRFIVHARDLIDEQRAVKDDLTAAREALASVSTAYQRTTRALEKRAADGVTVHIGADVETARKRIAHALTEPLSRAENVARETRLVGFLSGLTGAIIGAGGVMIVLIFN
ncbi:hypothetical protein ACLGGT_07070 [Roseovarius sp. MS2]|uniref:hypothetical protein n=1 Tax=Roseovarius sp. MS2 TaxID=3390728 RepID=UPI003EDC511F